jgi:hypothetical protein
MTQKDRLKKQQEKQRLRLEALKKKAERLRNELTRYLTDIDPGDETEEK